MTTTMQSIFDKVWNHLVVVQQKGSYVLDSDGFEGVLCRYRTEEGLACAAGCLAPDSAYDADWEDVIVSAIGYFNKKYNPRQLKLISQLQQAHDSSCRNLAKLDDAEEGDFVTLVSGALREVAIAYILTVPEEKST